MITRLIEKILNLIFLFKKPSASRRKAYILACLSIFILLPGLTVFFIKKWSFQENNQQFLSPFVSETTAQNQFKEEKIYPLDYYLSLSRSYLNKATRLANDNFRQSEADKKQILTTIDSALHSASLACEYFPNRPEAYLNRYDIYKKISHLYKEATQLAQQDLASANALLNKPMPSVNPIASINPLNFINTEEALVNQQIIIAEPNTNEGLVPNNDFGNVNTNALSGTAVIPTGQNEVKIFSSNIKPNQLIYVAPVENKNNCVLFVKAKKDGQWFVVGSDQVATTDLAFRWWQINEEQQ